MNTATSSNPLPEPYLTDSHCHLLDAPLRDKLPEVLQAAYRCNVRRFLVPCSRFTDFAALEALLDAQPDVYGAFGVHPWFVDETELPKVIDVLQSVLQRQPRALVGEIGLDNLHDTPDAAAKLRQQRFFAAQLDIAQQAQRPVVLHYAKSLDALLAAVKQCRFDCGGFVHGFGGSIEQAKPWLDLGFKLGIGALLLKPNARKIRHLLPHLQMQDFVLETDAPYMLAPAMQQTYSEPKFVRNIAEELANVYGTSWQDIARHSHVNFHAVVGAAPDFS